MIEPTGYTALDLVGFTDRGTYAANVNYVKNDLVHYGGNIWRILIDDTIGITPAEGPNYTLFIGEPTNLVERIIAPLEDNPATVAYQTGRQIIYNDYLYEVIQDIAIGDVLIAYEDDPTNANIKRSSPVETQVLALKADKVNKSDIANNVTTTVEGKVLDARQGKALQDGKTDTSVVAPVESGTTASRAYAIGAHFIKDGAFCTAKTAIAQGEAFTLNTNYIAESIGGVINDRAVVKTITSGSLHDITTPGIYYVTSAVTDRPTAVGGVYIVGKFDPYTIGGLYIDVYDDKVYHVRKSGDTWSTNEITIPEPVTITGITSYSGALAVPENVRGKNFISATIIGTTPGFVFRRDATYFTVLNNNMAPMANVSVTFQAIFI